MASEASKDTDRSSLLPSAKALQAEYGAAKSAATNAVKKLVARETVVDSMTYHAQELSSWGSLASTSFTVFNRRSLWYTAFKLLMLSIFVGVAVVLTVPDPAALKVSKFNAISNFLRVFVGLLLGFFMSASVNRWWGCVQGFLDLCGAIRKIQMMLISCDAPEEETRQCLRYGVLSAWILHMELHIQAVPLDDQPAAKTKHWEELRNGEDTDWFFAKLTAREADELQAMTDPAGTLWLWVGALLGRMAEESHLHSPPFYARFLALSGQGLDELISVRSRISVQAPYIYVHMLASLVHINNVVNALSFGMTGGVSLGTYLSWRGWLFFEKHTATEDEASCDLQSLLVSFFFTCFGPFVYQALLEVSIAIAQPFSNNDAIVPTKRILQSLQCDLHDAMESCKNIRARRPKNTKPSARRHTTVLPDGSKDIEAGDVERGDSGLIASLSPRD